MKPLRFKVTLIVFLLVLLGCGAGALALKTFLEISHNNQIVRQSILLRDWISALPSQPVREDLIKDLQAYRAELSPIERQKALSDIIQAYTSQNRILLRKRIDSFDQIEKNFIAQLEPQITLKERQTLYFGGIALASVFIGLFSFRSYIVRNVFDHLEHTTARMIDFLNGRYSYQFEVPPHNEVGDLQSTFNAMAQRVLQNMEDLKALDSAKSDFLNIASHELRTPMTSIKGSLGLLTSGALGELPSEAKQLVDIAETETNRLIRLTNDILDMAKIEAGKLTMKLSWTRIHDILEATRVGLHGLSETANITIEVVEHDNVEAFVDKDRIQQVITNLVSNAIKFSPKGTTVTVGVDVLKDENVIRIYVSDEGRGISPEDQKLLFEKFRQVTGPDNPLVKGTGLGLAIAKAIVEEHNGSIGVNSAPAKGSTFYFLLPNWRYIEAPVNSEEQSEDTNINFGVAA